MLNLLAAFKIIDLCISVLNLAIKALKRLLAEPSSLVTQPLLISADCRGFFHSSARWVGSWGRCQHFPSGDAPGWGWKHPAPAAALHSSCHTPGTGERLSLCHLPSLKGQQENKQRLECAAAEGLCRRPGLEILMSYILLMREAGETGREQ